MLVVGLQRCSRPGAPLVPQWLPAHGLNLKLVPLCGWMCIFRISSMIH